VEHFSLLRVGDDAQVIIWNLHSGELMQQFFCYFNGYVALSVWVNFGEQNDIGFAFGCADGSLHIYQQDKQTVQILKSFCLDELTICFQGLFAFVDVSGTYP